MSFESWLSERFTFSNEGRASWDRGIREMDCPFCKRGDNKFWFDLGRMRGGCLHKATCSWSGDAVRLVQAIEGCSLREAIELVRREGGGAWRPRRQVLADGATDEGGCRLPYEYVPLVPGLPVGTRATVAAYLVGRGVTFELIRQRRFGYCVSGQYTDRIIMPVVESNEIIYFVARLFRGTGKPYRYPTTAEAGGRGPSDVLFNLDGVRGRPRVRVVEGVFDCLAEERRGEASVAMLGLTISEIQSAKLALAGCREAVVECDGDAPRREVEKIARRLEGVMRVSVARPERDPDQQAASPVVRAYGLVGRVAGRLRGD